MADRAPRSAPPAAAALMATLLGLAEVAVAEPRNFVLRQLTHVTTGDIEWPRIRMQDGDAVSFTSTADVLGPGTETASREIYLWRDGGLITRLTDSGPYDSYDATRPTDYVNSGGRPDIVVFVSTADHADNNPDHNEEIFIVEIDNPGVFHQLTDSQPPTVNGEPFASDNGRCIVFSSNDDLAVGDDERTDPSVHPDNGFRNPDGSVEVFMYSKLDATEDYPFTGYFAQMSNGVAPTVSSRPVVGGYWWTRQCQTAPFQSTGDQIPDDGHDDVGSHVYVYRRTNGQIERMDAPRELLHGYPDGNYINPFISAASPFARGPHVVFEAEPDLWNNGSTGSDVFRYRIFHPRMTQYSNVGAGHRLEHPVVSDGGGVIVFDSTAEHIARVRRGSAGNADGNAEIYRLKGRRKVWQITNTELAGDGVTPCENTHASIQDDGRAIVFRSTCDLVPGRNPDGLPQIFLWEMVKRKDPLYGQCPADPNCCTEVDCYEEIFGRQQRPPRANCLDKSRCN